MGDDSRSGEIVELLKEIRDNQKLQIERNAESMAIQKEHSGLAVSQMARAEKLQTSARKELIILLVIVAITLIVLLKDSLF